jgi:hypothetical protein
MPQAGLLELVAHGIQDIYLIGNPQITFFKTAYKRHTNFSMEAFQISYDAKPQFGSKTTFSITRYADLIHTMFLEVDLPAISANYTFDASVGVASSYSNGMGDITWVNNTGHAILNYADILIGKQLIDRQYGEWMEIWTQLTQSESKKRGLDLLLNRNSTLIVNPGPLTLYIPFQFWFCRNIGLALPLVALQYHDISLEVNFRPLSQMYTFVNPNYGTSIFYNVTSTGSSNIVNITKPYSSALDLSQLDAQANIIVFPDGTQYFIHPNDPIPLGGGQDGSIANPWQVRLTQIPPAWTNASCYIKPNGVINMTTQPQITEVRLYVDYIYLDTVEQREFATAKHRYLIEQIQYSGSESISAGTNTKRLKINFNLPIKELFWLNQLNAVYNTNDLFNYSNTVDAYQTPGNIMTSGLIYINGIERFSQRTGNYFRLIQPYQKHTRSPNNFVYSYAFSVRPEEHQPSGCSNFSKIDTKELFMNLSPNLGDCNLRVYGLNYNILRIYSGMGGIAFSN